MCLIVLAWQVDENCPLVVAANRDEYYDRPSRAAHWWGSPHCVFAGRDLRAGGTWCGVDRKGRFAAVTNVREENTADNDCHEALLQSPLSRGRLVADYFAAHCTAKTWACQVADKGGQYGPFNLLVGDSEQLWFVSNRDCVSVRHLPAGVWAVSNGQWKDRWPKAEWAKSELKSIINTGCYNKKTLFGLLSNTQPAPDHCLPGTGIGLAQERLLSPVFVRGECYGTRVSTVITRDSGGTLDFEERDFTPSSLPMHRVHEQWLIDDSL